MTRLPPDNIILTKLVFHSPHQLQTVHNQPRQNKIHFLSCDLEHAIRSGKITVHDEEQRYKINSAINADSQIVTGLVSKAE